MPYIRVSVAKPRKGEEARLEDLMRKLSALSAEQSGCLEELGAEAARQFR